MRPQMEGTVAREDLVVAGPTLDDVLGTHPVLLAGGCGRVVISDAATYAAVMQGRMRPAGMTDEEFAQLKPPEKEQEINGDTTFYVRRIPAAFDVIVDFMKRGQERFDVYCAPVPRRIGVWRRAGGASGRRSCRCTSPDAVSGWVAPQNLQEAKIVARPDGSIFNTITNGIRNDAGV